MKKGFNKINQICQITDFGETLGQLKVQLSLKLNGIEKNYFFCRKGVNGIEMSHKMST